MLPGDVVKVTLNEACDIADQGKTIAELYPDEELPPGSDFTISDEMAAELRARPRVHDDFIVQVETSFVQQVRAASDDLNTDFTFGLLWDSFCPNQARVRLTTYCLNDVLTRTGGTRHLQTTLSLGDSASFLLVK
jgi:hypothetical protein